MVARPPPILSILGRHTHKNVKEKKVQTCNKFTKVENNQNQHGLDVPSYVLIYYSQQDNLNLEI